MTFSTNFIVFGDPVGKGRPKFARRGNFVSTYTPVKTKNYEDKIREATKIAMGEHEPLETPVNVYVYIRCSVPKAYSKKRTEDCLNGLERPCKKPDLDNVAKCFLDAMNLIAYKDDSQVVELHVTKVYSQTAAVEVLVTENLL